MKNNNIYILEGENETLLKYNEFLILKKINFNKKRIIKKIFIKKNFSYIMKIDLFDQYNILSIHIDINYNLNIKKFNNFLKLIDKEIIIFINVKKNFVYEKTIFTKNKIINCYINNQKVFNKWVHDLCINMKLNLDNNSIIYIKNKYLYNFDELFNILKNLKLIYKNKIINLIELKSILSINKKIYIEDIYLYILLNKKLNIFNIFYNVNNTEDLEKILIIFIKSLINTLFIKKKIKINNFFFKYNNDSNLITKFIQIISIKINTKYIIKYINLISFELINLKYNLFRTKYILIYIFFKISNDLYNKNEEK